MHYDSNSIEHQILDLTVDMPNSFSSLYRDLVNLYGYPRQIDCSYLLDVLLEMEKAGLLRTIMEDEQTHLSDLGPFDRSRIASEYAEWLTKAHLADLSFDELGLWIEITEPGRESWRDWAKLFGDDTIEGDWQADLNFENGEVRLISRNESEARRILEELCVLKKITPLFSTLNLRTVEGYKLRNGNVLHSGVVLTCKFRGQR
jgi:hypothetical protein